MFPFGVLPALTSAPLNIRVLALKYFSSFIANARAEYPFISSWSISVGYSFIKKVRTPISYSREALWIRLTWFLGDDSEP